MLSEYIHTYTEGWTFEMTFITKSLLYSVGCLFFLTVHVQWIRIVINLKLWKGLDCIYLKQ